MISVFGLWVENEGGGHIVSVFPEFINVESQGCTESVNTDFQILLGIWLLWPVWLIFVNARYWI